MIVSIHIPKTAGTSFGLSLKQHFGKGFRSDYLDKVYGGETEYERKASAMTHALAMHPEEFGEIECVHGHFLACKYGLLAAQTDCEFVTWLRHPLTRLMSHYYYWIEAYDENTSTGFHKQIVEEKWSFERFALCPEFRNLQSEFLWSTPLQALDFVGIAEHYAEDYLRFCCEFLGGEPETYHLNPTASKPPLDAIGVGLRKDIELYHADDMALYEGALARRSRELTKASLHIAS